MQEHRHEETRINAITTESVQENCGGGRAAQMRGHRGAGSCAASRSSTSATSEITSENGSKAVGASRFVASNAHFAQWSALGACCLSCCLLWLPSEGIEHVSACAAHGVAPRCSSMMCANWAIPPPANSTATSAKSGASRLRELRVKRHMNESSYHPD